MAESLRLVGDILGSAVPTPEVKRARAAGAKTSPRTPPSSSPPASALPSPADHAFASRPSPRGMSSLSPRTSSSNGAYGHANGSPSTSSPATPRRGSSVRAGFIPPPNQPIQEHAGMVWNEHDKCALPLPLPLHALTLLLL